MPQLGTAKRSDNKRARIETHQEALKWCFENFEIDRIIEDGMGLGSTPFFHQQLCEHILSFESRAEWAKCSSCPNFPTKKHEIVVGNVDENRISSFIRDHNEKILLFIDGVSRFEVLKMGVNLQLHLIVEHDAESFSETELEARKALLVDYHVFQHVGKNPETMVCVRKDLVDQIKNEMPECVVISKT